MEIKLRNPKGTKDYLPEEQCIRNNIRKTLEEIFEKYGYMPLETPILNHFDVLASKYAGGTEILKEIYKFNDQGKRELALRYDLTVPFAKVVGLNPNIRLPFKRFEIGKVFRDGPVKLGRNREFIQCDVDVVGVKSVIAEAELILMTLEAFNKLGLDVFIEYNNRKLLSGIIKSLNVNEKLINDVILSLDKIEKIGQEEVVKELIDKGLEYDFTKTLIDTLNSIKNNPINISSISTTNDLIYEGLKELDELKSYLEAMNIMDKVVFNPFLARGLDIYTGTVYEVFLSDNSVTSSVGSGGRYDNIIGSFLDNGNEYPAVGMSFGLDVIYTALSIKNISEYKSPIDLLIIPLGTEIEPIKLAKHLREKGLKIDIETTNRKLKKSLNDANRKRIPYVIILGENEIKEGIVVLKDMINGEEQKVNYREIYEKIKVCLNGME